MREGLRPAVRGLATASGSLSHCVQPLGEGCCLSSMALLLKDHKLNFWSLNEILHQLPSPQRVSVFLLLTPCEHTGTGARWPGHGVGRAQRAAVPRPLWRGRPPAQLSHRTVGSAHLCPLPRRGNGDDNPFCLTGLLRGIEASGNKCEELRTGAGTY